MARRTYTQDFKDSAARLVTEQGYSLSQAAKSLGVDHASIRSWIAKLSPAPGAPAPADDPAALRPEVACLREENRRLAMEREILKKGDGLLRRGAAVRSAFIDEHRGTFPIELMCGVLGVTRGGYYAWRGRPESARAQRQAELVEAIEAVHRESRGTYGSPRVHKALEAKGQAC